MSKCATAAQKLTLLGYYGFNNAGDEALLAALLQGVAQLVPALQPVVLSADPPGTVALHQVAAAQRWHLRAILRTLRGSQALFLGGGSLLQDITSRRSVYYYLGILSLAQFMGVRTCLFGQGIGPLRSPLARFWAQRALNRCQGIWLRDEESYREVLKLGVCATSTKRGPVLCVSGDPAFLLTPELKTPAAEANTTTAPQWVVAVRPWPAPAGVSENDWQKAIALALAQTAQAAGAQLLFITMQPSADTPLAKALCQLVTGNGVAATVVQTATFKQVQSIINQADFVISMRLHALVMAISSGIAAVAISYDPKVSALAHKFQLPGVSWTDVTGTEGAVKLTSEIGIGWHQAATAGPILRRLAAETRTQVLVDLSQALALCDLLKEGAVCNR